MACSSSRVDKLRGNLYHAHVLRRLPKFASAFAYGASSPTPDVPSQMLDYVIVVEDAHKWHEENIELNPSHYSSQMLEVFGATGCEFGASDNVGIGIHFNTFVDIDAPNLEAFKAQTQISQHRRR